MSTTISKANIILFLGIFDYFLNELFPGKNLDVFDPWYGTEKDFVSVFEQINQTADIIIKKYNRNL